MTTWTVWPLQENRRFDAQDLRELFHSIQSRGIDAAFERTQIGAVHVCLIGQRFLRQPAGTPLGLQIQGKDLSEVHDREGNGLWEISPRDISNNPHREGPAGKGIEDDRKRF